MKTLEIDESKIKECMKECSEFKSIAERLWPELKGESKNVTRECIIDVSGGWLHIKHDQKYIGLVTKALLIENGLKNYEFRSQNGGGIHVYKR